LRKLGIAFRRECGEIILTPTLPRDLHLKLRDPGISGETLGLSHKKSYYLVLSMSFAQTT
jgi:hypothetical protein